MAEPDARSQGAATVNNVDNAVGKRYWEGVEADVNAMLGGVPMVGGFSYVSKVDLQGSRSFLAKLGIGSKNGRRRVAAALEGGAGFVIYDVRGRPTVCKDANLSRGTVLGGLPRVSCWTLPLWSTLSSLWRSLPRRSTARLAYGTSIPWAWKTGSPPKEFSTDLYGRSGA